MTAFRCFLSVQVLLCACCIMTASPVSAAGRDADTMWSFETSPEKEFSHIHPAANVTLASTSFEPEELTEQPVVQQQSRKDDAAERRNRDKWLEHARKNPDMVLGQASWYGRDFDRKATASGLPYDMYTFTAAHRTLPIGTVVRVTDQYNGKSVMVCVTDRGPYAKGRILDLSFAAADSLDLKDRGVANVGMEVVSDAQGVPLSRDKAFFVQLDAARDEDKLGPYFSFADAAAMHEAMLRGHPEAKVVLDKAE